MNENGQITKLLADWSNGDQESLERLLPLVEVEMRRIAHNFMRRESNDHTLQTTALVNEAYLKLVNQRQVNWQNRSHFFALTAHIMRRILLNHARDRAAQKRGANAEHVSLEEAEILSSEKSREIIALNDVLHELEKFDKLKSQIVELRYFGGLSIEETAQVLQISTASVSIQWRLAKAWLSRELKTQQQLLI